MCWNVCCTGTPLAPEASPPALLAPRARSPPHNRPMSPARGRPQSPLRQPFRPVSPSKDRQSPFARQGSLAERFRKAHEDGDVVMDPADRPRSGQHAVGGHEGTSSPPPLAAEASTEAAGQAEGGKAQQQPLSQLPSQPASRPLSRQSSRDKARAGGSGAGDAGERPSSAVSRTVRCKA